MGAATYFASFGPALMGGGGPGNFDQPDDAVVEVADTGTTRVLTNTPLSLGLLVSGPGELTVSDCVQQRIFTVDTTTGAQNDRATAADGLVCPTGMVRDGAGTIFFLETDLGGSANSTVSQLVAAGTVQTNWATNFPVSSIFFARLGTSLFAAGIGDSSGGQTFPIYSVDAATSGNAATQLVPGPTIGSSSIATTPDGRLIAIRQGIGEILEVDAATGALTHFGSTLAPGMLLGPGGGSFAWGVAFKPDGTMVIPDSGQGGMISVTP
jgi:hypothetical protein